MTNIDVIADPNSPAAAWGRVTARRLARTAATAERKRLQVGVSRAVIEALSEEPDGEGKIHRFLWLVFELAELAAPRRPDDSLRERVRHNAKVRRSLLPPRK